MIAEMQDSANVQNCGHQVAGFEEESVSLKVLVMIEKGLLS